MKTAEHSTMKAEMHQPSADELSIIFDGISAARDSSDTEKPARSKYSDTLKQADMRKSKKDLIKERDHFRDVMHVLQRERDNLDVYYRPTNIPELPDPRLSSSSTPENVYSIAKLPRIAHAAPQILEIPPVTQQTRPASPEQSPAPPSAQQNSDDLLKAEIQLLNRKLRKVELQNSQLTGEMLNQRISHDHIKQDVIAFYMPILDRYRSEVQHLSISNEKLSVALHQNHLGIEVRMDEVTSSLQDLLVFYKRHVSCETLESCTV